MLTSLFGFTYGASVLGIGYNFSRIRNIDDFTEGIKQYREYDFTYEKVDHHTLPTKSLVLVHIGNNEDNIKFAKQPEMTVSDSIKEGESLLYSKVISFSNLLDPVMYYQQKFPKNTIKLRILNEKSEQELEIDFSRSTWTMFDLNTVGVSTKHHKWSLSDRMKYLYYRGILRRDFTFMEKGIYTNRDYIIAGNLVYEENALRLKNPNMVIGSDKQELMEFMGRKREHWLMNVRNFVKLAVAVTFVHILLVRIPYAFEAWFGDMAKVTLPQKREELYAPEVVPQEGKEVKIEQK